MNKNEIKKSFLKHIGENNISENFINDLFNLELMEVYPLNEKETFVIRECFGFSGERINLSKIAEKLYISPQYARNLHNQAIKWIKIFGLVENELFDLHLSRNIIVYLFCFGITTLDVLLALRKEDIIKIDGIGEKLANEIVSTITNAGLEFRNEIVLGSRKIDNYFIIADYINKKVKKMKE